MNPSVTAAERPEVMSVPSDRLKKDHTRHVKERVIEALLLLAAFVSVFTTTAIVYILVKESWLFFQHVPLTDFLFDTQWTPLFDDAHFGFDGFIDPAIGQITAGMGATAGQRHDLRLG